MLHHELQRRSLNKVPRKFQKIKRNLHVLSSPTVGRKKKHAALPFIVDNNLFHCCRQLRCPLEDFNRGERNVQSNSGCWKWGERNRNTMQGNLRHAPWYIALVVLLSRAPNTIRRTGVLKEVLRYAPFWQYRFFLNGNIAS